MGLRRAAARLLVLTLVLTSFAMVTWTRDAATPANAAVVGAPSWWVGDCDATHFNSKARSLGWRGAGAHRLGASYLGVPACGPRPSVEGSPDVLWTRAGWGEYEWECVELAQRFMAQIYGVRAYQANGNQVVSHYSTAYGGGLVRINNGTAGHAPQPGDVISFTSSTNRNGHVAVVTSSSVNGLGTGSVMTMEQNYSAAGWRTLSVVGWRVQATGNLTPYGWLHDPQQRGNPGATLPTTMNLLSNSSFELGTGSGWVPGTLPGALTRAVVASSAAASAQEGGRFLRLTATARGASTWQVAGAPKSGRSFTFSAWVRSTGPNTTGRLVLTADGGTPETEVTTFTAGPKWSLVSVPLSVTVPGHTGLRAEVAVTSTDAPLDVDGSQLADAGLGNASFELGTGGWASFANAGSVTRVWGTASGQAVEGNAFMGVTSKVTAGSVAQMVVALPQVGHTYTFSAWVRSATGKPVSGTLRVSTVGGTAEVGNSPFTAGPQWKLVSSSSTVIRTGHTAFRVEAVLSTVSTRLDLDGTQLVDDGLRNASLEQSTTAVGWTPSTVATTLTEAVGSTVGFAREGFRYLYLRTSTSGASVRQASVVLPAAGRTYTFSAWLRTAPGSAPVSGRIAVSTLGGTAETGSTPFTVGAQWTHVSAPVSVTRAGHSGLMTQVALTTTGRTLYLDATSLVAGNARASDITPPQMTLRAHPAERSTTQAATFAMAASDPDSAPGTLSYHCAVDAIARACGSTLTLAGLRQGTHTFAVSATDPAGNRSATVSFAWTIDSIAPAVTLRGPTAAFTLQPTTHVSWSAADAGSGVDSYDVRMRVATWSTGFGAWAQPASWTRTKTTSIDPTGLAPGRTYCFSVRARDAFGNLSAWSVPRCTSRALDDRVLHAGTGWVPMASSGYYFSTLLATRQPGVVLTRPYAQLDRVALVATRCPTCGVVGVYVGSTLVGKVNLYAPTLQRQQLLVLPAFSLRTGTVVIKTLTNGKVVQIDGLGISRS